MTISKEKPTLIFQEDRILEGVALQVTADLKRSFSKERLQHAATKEERLRLARELHDGVLQSLTAATLQLETLSQLVEENPQAARKRLCDIEELIAEQQRELRAWIQKLKSTTQASMVSNTDLAVALDKLCRRFEWHCGLRIKLAIGDRGTMTRTLGDEVYRLVKEALNNVARHAFAHVAHVELAFSTGRVHIGVSDDGCGFPFRGQYDLATLNARQLGPISLKERIVSLRGELILTSSPSGSRLEISLPLDQDAAP